MIISQRILNLFALFAVLLCCSPTYAEQQKSVVIEPQADEALKQMSTYLDSLQQFTIHIENSTDVLLTSGHKMQVGETVNVAIQRPNRLWGNIEGDARSQQLFYDGENITLYGRKVNYYATAKAPSTIEATLDFARESFGLLAPAADIVAREAYTLLTENVNSGIYLGLHRVHGIECHHLLFSQDEVDWQIWIENSQTPLPRKLIITEKLYAGGLQFTSLFLDWNFSPQLQENHFVFTPPDTAKKIEFLPADKTAADYNK